MGSALLKLGGANLPPNRCMFCACAPVDSAKNIMPMVTCEGMDINWGETPYICMTCCGIIADLIGRPDEITVKKVYKGAKAQKEHNEKLVKENNKLTELVEGLIEGKDVMDKAKELVGNGD